MFINPRFDCISKGKIIVCNIWDRISKTILQEEKSKLRSSNCIFKPFTYVRIAKKVNITNIVLRIEIYKSANCLVKQLGHC